MLAYEESKELLEFLNAPNVQQRLWSARSGWRMAQNLHEVLIKHTSATILAAQSPISISADESTSAAGEGRLAVHAYHVSNWERVAGLVGLPQITSAPNAEYISSLILQGVLTLLSITAYQLACILVMIAADGASVMQGILTGVIVRLQQRAAPFALAMHCHAHRADLAGKTLSESEELDLLFELVKLAYSIFDSSILHRLALIEIRRELDCTEVLAKKMPKRDVLTRWISHTAPCQVLWELLPALLVWTTQLEQPKPRVISLVTMLLNVRLHLLLAAVLPLLVKLQILIKTLQKKNIYILVRSCPSKQRSFQIDQEC